jgi:hypothetical protein
LLIITGRLTKKTRDGITIKKISFESSEINDRSLVSIYNQIMAKSEVSGKEAIIPAIKE